MTERSDRTTGRIGRRRLCSVGDFGQHRTGITTVETGSAVVQFQAIGPSEFLSRAEAREFTTSFTQLDEAELLLRDDIIYDRLYGVAVGAPPEDWEVSDGVTYGPEMQGRSAEFTSDTGARATFLLLPAQLSEHDADWVQSTFDNFVYIHDPDSVNEAAFEFSESQVDGRTVKSYHADRSDFELIVSDSVLAMFGAVGLSEEEWKGWLDTVEFRSGLVDAEWPASE